MPFSQKKPLFVANWKMYKNYHETRAWLTDNATALAELTPHASLVICPTFPTLPLAVEIGAPLDIALGGQDCSAQSAGAFTGQVNAETLYQVGCTYCIVGHREQRQHLHETDDTVAQKAALLLAHEIIPIVCIGEEQAHDSLPALLAALEKQLLPLQRINAQRFVTPHLCIAYEPGWAIGSNKIPEISSLAAIFSALRTYCGQQFPSFTLEYLYGGSVNSDTSPALARVPGIDGFLIGSASLDFQNFKNIVLSSNTPKSLDK